MHSFTAGTRYTRCANEYDALHRWQLVNATVVQLESRHLEPRTYCGQGLDVFKYHQLHTASKNMLYGGKHYKYSLPTSTASTRLRVVVRIQKIPEDVGSQKKGVDEIISRCLFLAWWALRSPCRRHQEPERAAQHQQQEPATTCSNRRGQLRETALPGSFQRSRRHTRMLPRRSRPLRQRSARHPR